MPVLLMAFGLFSGGLARAENPIAQEWYADPDASVFAGQYWIFLTLTGNYGEQVYFDAFPSPDLVNWTKHDRVMNNRVVTWADSCMWAPGITEKNGKYYCFFSAKGLGFSQSIGVVGNSLEPFEKVATVLRGDDKIAAGSGHQWHQSGRFPIWIATSVILWILAILYSIIALVPINNRIKSFPITNWKKDRRRWDLLHR